MFGFLNRTARLERIFKLTIAMATAGLIAIVLTVFPPADTWRAG